MHRLIGLWETRQNRSMMSSAFSLYFALAAAWLSEAGKLAIGGGYVETGP
jgi:hypothetical protein